MAATVAVDKLNSLLRGEISAIETYQQAMEKVGDDPSATSLHKMHSDHVDAANALRRHVRQHGGEPEQGSGAWGKFAKAVEGGATLLGNSAALKALKEGEETGIKSYEKALQDTDLPSDCRSLIQTTLLPQTKAHLPVLDGLLRMQSAN